MDGWKYVIMCIALMPIAWNAPEMIAYRSSFWVNASEYHSYLPLINP